VSVFAALVELPGAAWPAVFGTAIALVAWLELHR